MRQAGARASAGRRWQQARGAHAGGAAGEAQARGALQAGRRRGARGRQALVGARASFGLCTRPVFGPVRLGIFLSQIFGQCS